MKTQDWIRTVSSGEEDGKEGFTSSKNTAIKINIQGGKKKKKINVQREPH